MYYFKSNIRHQESLKANKQTLSFILNQNIHFLDGYDTDDISLHWAEVPPGKFPVEVDDSDLPTFSLKKPVAYQERVIGLTTGDYQSAFSWDEIFFGYIVNKTTIRKKPKLKKQ